jgi:hypothetical protein
MNRAQEGRKQSGGEASAFLSSVALQGIQASSQDQKKTAHHRHWQIASPCEVVIRRCGIHLAVRRGDQIV